MKNKIKYKMFLNRKKFNVINWIKNTKNANYELFCRFLESRDVISPGLEYFNKALDFYNKNVVSQKKVVEKVKEEKSLAQKIVQIKDLVEKKESVTEEIKAEEPPPKKTRRRRRTKKS